jgi:hypothetical protein
MTDSTARVMFASKLPGEPLREYMECRHGDVPDGGPGDCVMCTPRWVEFPHVQHNPPNPILVAVSTSGIDVEEWHAAVFSTEIYGGLRAWSDEAHPFHVLTKATGDEVDHADRVLDRLVRAKWEATS